MTRFHISMPRTIVRLTGLLLIGVAAFPPAMGAAVLTPSPPLDSETTTCFNLDVVFIIDQSNSMSEPGTASDPAEQRKFTSHGMVDLLSDIALDECPDAVHRMAVVSFGTDSEVDLRLSNIAPETLTEAQALRSELKKYIAARRMGQTDPGPAFTLAAGILDDAELAGEGMRKRVIVFVTDGEPCLAQRGCTSTSDTMDHAAYAREMRGEVSELLPFDDVLLQQEDCLNKLADEFGGRDQIPDEPRNECLDQYRVDASAYQRSTYIFTVLLKASQTYLQSVVNVYTAMSEEHGGRLVKLSQNVLDIPVVLRQILSQLAGVRASRLECGNFAVNPYLKSARVTIHKIDPDLPVTISYTDVDGVRHEITGGEASATGGFDLLEPYDAYGTNERYVFARPYPGIWQLTADNCDGFDAFYDEIEINPTGYQPNLPAEVPEYDRGDYYDPERPFYLEYQTKDESDVVVPQADHPRFAVDIRLTVTDADNQKREYILEWSPTDNLFRATQPVQLPGPGTYKINVVGTTFYHEGEPWPVGDTYSEVFSATRELFRHENVEFKVFEVTPFAIEIISPTENEPLRPIHGALNEGWPLPVKPISVRARFVTEAGEPWGDLTRVLADTERVLTAVITAGGETSELITLQPDPSVAGEYFGSIEGFDASGSQRLVVELQSDYSDHYRPDSRQVSVNFSRSDYLWTNPVSYYGALGVMIALISAAIVYNIVIRTNKVTGTLIFLSGDHKIAEFGLGSGKNWAVISPRALQQYEHLGLKWLRVENIRRPAAKRRRAKDDAVLEEEIFEDTTASAVVRARGKTLKGRKFAVDLTPDLPTTYSDDESVAEMVYRELE